MFNVTYTCSYYSSKTIKKTNIYKIFTPVALPQYKLIVLIEICSVISYRMCLTNFDGDLCEMIVAKTTVRYSMT